MYLFSNENGKVGIECDGCGKVYLYNNKYFSYVSNTACINNTLLQCPNCYKEVKTNTKIFAKENSTVTKKDSNSTSGSGATAIGIIVVAFIIIGLIALVKSCGNNYAKEYERDLEKALNKPYNDLNREERDMVDDYIEWYVEENLD